MINILARTDLCPTESEVNTAFDLICRARDFSNQVLAKSRLKILLSVVTLAPQQVYHVFVCLFDKQLTCQQRIQGFINLAQSIEQFCYSHIDDISTENLIFFQNSPEVLQALGKVTRVLLHLSESVPRTDLCIFLAKHLQTFITTPLGPTFIFTVLHRWSEFSSGRLNVLPFPLQKVLINLNVRQKLLVLSLSDARAA